MRVFSNLSSLLGINMELLKRLEAAEGKQIGSIFVDMSPYLKMYSIYCANQDTSLGSLCPTPTAPTESPHKIYLDLYWF